MFIEIQNWTDFVEWKIFFFSSSFIEVWRYVQNPLNLGKFLFPQPLCYYRGSCPHLWFLEGHCPLISWRNRGIKLLNNFWWVMRSSNSYCCLLYHPQRSCLIKKKLIIKRQCNFIVLFLVPEPCNFSHCNTRSLVHTQLHLLFLIILVNTPPIPMNLIGLGFSFTN